MARPTSRQRSELSDAVAQLRAVIGDTQQQFAARLGIAITTIARYETNRPPQGAILVQFMKLADTYGRVDLARVFQQATSAELGHNVQRLAQSRVPELRPGEAEEVMLLLTILRSSENSEAGKLRTKWSNITAKLRKSGANSDSLAVRHGAMVDEVRRRVSAGEPDGTISDALPDWKPEDVKKIAGSLRREKAASK